MQGLPIRIGTRGSPLALAQAHEVRRKLMAVNGGGEDDYPIVVIKTTGDLVLDRPLAEIGGKGLFTKEIEEALFNKTIDIAVHSMKDVQTVLPGGLAIGAILEREDVRDAFISRSYATLSALPAGAKVGTSSLRRAAQVRRARPDLEVVGFRGNVQTRLRKLEEGVADATFLACAGLNRLGMAEHITAAMPVDVMLPAVAQGAIGIEMRDDDSNVRTAIAQLNHEHTASCVASERAFLAKLEGSCRTPIAGLAGIADGKLTLSGSILAPDGSDECTTECIGPVEDAERIGTEAGSYILANANAGLLPHIN